MSSGRRKSKGKKINPTFFVFCEGETEEAYINLLKTEYRIPSIIIHAKIRGNNITDKYINSYKKTRQTHEKDKTILFYDLDTPSILKRLNQIKGSIILASNPCIELWFLLHYRSHSAETNVDYCCKELKNRNGKYKKGFIDSKLKDKLIAKKSDAIKRAKELNPYDNPSSTVFRIIEILEELKKTK